MLSQATLSFLDDHCKRAHAAFPEGGTLWTYIEAASQAHTRFKDHRRKPAADALDIEELATWLQAAEGNFGALLPQAIEQANTLIDLLRADLGVDEFLWYYQNDGDVMNADIHMARRADNRYFALELWWSFD
ncbi:MULTISPECIES: hypothetical protein [unclassified Achromobacter]|uniref:hypothetical protein n=1 Tax=unclassified Achromobacter TaxID=2626865 RepID=UPI000B519447|nr:MULTISPECIES: hypothetical protein [unclassified Achromobacter]OWT71403.1 hypothetical protein CEY05_24750 [Achromobacter sp. HZ34]OWT73060.1 hypothetical protein CEY04_23585 [Achromobacter sp. HZ28]